MIVVLERMASLGIRAQATRLGTWVGTNLCAAMLAFGPAARAMVPYAALMMFTVWRLKR